MDNSERKKKYFRKLRTVGDLKSYFPIFQRLHHVANDPSSSAADLANVILHDHAFTTKVLKVANSSFYHYRGKINTLTVAIVVMGFKGIKNLALSVGIYETFRKHEQCESFDYPRFWAHSLATGVTAHWLTGKLQPDLREEAFVAGFLHDIGRLVIASFTPENWEAIYEKIRTGRTPMQAEFSELGMYHSDVGAFAADLWEFPSTLAEPIRDHHQLHGGRIGRTLVDYIYLSNRLASLVYPCMEQTRESSSEVYKVASEMFALDKETLDNFLAGLKDQIEETAREFAIPLEGLLDLAETPDLLSPGQVTQAEHQLLAKRNKQREREILLHQELMRAYRQTDNVNEVLSVLAEGVIRGLDQEFAILLKVNEKGRILEGKTGYVVDAVDKIKHLRYDLGQVNNVFVDTVLHRKAQLVVDATHKAYREKVDSSFVKQFRAAQFACVPLEAWERVVALLVFGRHEYEPPLTDDLLTTVSRLAEQAGLALERYLPRPSK